MKAVLGIESSCDETGVALLSLEGEILAHALASQVEVHRPYRGVVPEIAARHHLLNLPVLYEEAMRKAKIAREEIAMIGVTRGPGLIAALLVGVAFAKALAISLERPLYGINHLQAHLFSPFTDSRPPEKFLGLVVSGSHSSCYLVRGGTIKRLNRTRDDAPGEAFDKVATLLGLPYPGGPVIDRLSKEGDANAFTFKIPSMSDGSYDFSFSGIKSSIARMVDHHPTEFSKDTGITRRGIDLVASFQKAVVNQLLHRLTHFHTRYPLADVAVSGGVAANSHLRKKLGEWALERNVKVHLPDMHLVTDNGIMVAYRTLLLNDSGIAGDDPLDLDADPSLGQR